MKDDIFWLVLKFEISYRVMIYLERFWFLLEDFEKKNWSFEEHCWKLCDFFTVFVLQIGHV